MGIATTTQSLSVQELHNGNPNGVRMGRTAGDLISFYGAAPAPQQSGATSNVADTASTLTLSAVQTGSTAGVGFSTAALFNAYVSTIAFLQTDVSNLRKNLNALHQAMSSTGFTKGS